MHSGLICFDIKGVNQHVHSNLKFVIFYLKILHLIFKNIKKIPPTRVKLILSWHFEILQEIELHIQYILQ